jgi:hypothetical protein
MSGCTPTDRPTPSRAAPIGEDHKQAMRERQVWVKPLFAEAEL